MQAPEHNRLVNFCMNEFNVKIDAVLNFSLMQGNLVLVMIVRLDQKTKHAKWEMYIKSMHYMKLLWSCSILIAPVVYGFNLWLNTFVMLKNATKGSWIVAPSLSSNYYLS